MFGSRQDTSEAVSSNVSHMRIQRYSVSPAAFDLSEPCGIRSGISSKTKRACGILKEGHKREGDGNQRESPRNGSTHMLRPSVGITPQPSVGLCGDTRLD